MQNEKQITLRITEEQYNFLASKAKEEGSPISFQIRLAIKKSMKGGK